MKYIFAIIGFLLVNFVNGQRIKFKKLTTNDGLLNNTVSDIIGDKEGVLWDGTWDGLNLYDGRIFLIYKYIEGDSTSISGNVIRRLIRDGNEKIWVLTNNKSVDLYLGNGKFKNYFFESQPTDMTLSADGELIVEINSLDAHLFDDGQFVKTSTERSGGKDNSSLNDMLHFKYPELYINESIRDSNGNIWYATQNNGLYIIRNNSSNINNEPGHHYAYPFDYSGQHSKTLGLIRKHTSV